MGHTMRFIQFALIAATVILPCSARAQAGAEGYLSAVAYSPAFNAAVTVRVDGGVDDPHRDLAARVVLEISVELVVADLCGLSGNRLE